MTFDGKDIVFLDFETVYDTANGYDLKNLSMTEYIRDSRFKAHGVAYQCSTWATKDVIWVSGDKLAFILADIDWCNTVIVSHNVKFDGSILAWRYGIKPYAWFDTVALAKATLGENVSGYHLAGLAQYLGLQAKGTLKWDGVRDLTPAQEAEMAEYCKGDVTICKGIYEKLIGQFPQGQLAVIDWTIRAFIEPKLVLNENVLRDGVQNEKTRREEIISKAIPEIHAHRTRLERDWYDSFQTRKVPFEEPRTGIDEAKSVLASNKQFAELLSQRGMVVPTKISLRTGRAIPAFARTDDGLSQLATSAPALYAARIASKANLLETRGEALLAVAKTGAFPFDVGFSGAVQTHRYSGASGAGGNPQNFTRKSFLREAVCAPVGHSLVVGDFSAVELRILAWLAKELRLINKLINDEDVYADFASQFYGKPVPPKEPTPERFFGKCAILGLGYGMGGEKFQKTVKQQLKQDITEGAAYGAVKFYRTNYFNVPKLWEACSSLIPLIADGRIGCLYFAPFIKVRKGAIILPSGLAIQYPNLRRIGDEWVYDVYRKKYESEPTKLYGGKMVENICQGLAGELTKEAITAAEASGLSCCMQVHDEIGAVVPHGREEWGKKTLQSCMERSPSWWPILKLKAEVGYGINWNQAKH